MILPTPSLLAVGKICAMVAVLGDELGSRSGGRELLRSKLTSLVAGGAHLVSVVVTAIRRDDPDVIDTTGDPLPDGTSHADRVRHPFAGRQAAFREARHLSRTVAADEARKMLVANDLLGGRTVTKDIIEGYEERNTVPRNQLLLAALDRLYGADGSACFVEVTTLLLGPASARESRLNVWQVAFPGFWVGPVCLVAHSPAGDPNDTGRLGLRWGAWANDLLVRHGKAISTRQDEPHSPPLQVLLEVGWRLQAFVGEHPDAVDISSDGWHAAPGKERDLYRHYIENYKDLAAAITEQDRSTFQQAFIDNFGDDGAGRAT